VWIEIEMIVLQGDESWHAEQQHNNSKLHKKKNYDPWSLKRSTGVWGIALHHTTILKKKKKNRGPCIKK
jgi:hypothetical protein